MCVESQEGSRSNPSLFHHGSWSRPTDPLQILTLSFAWSSCFTLLASLFLVLETLTLMQCQSLAKLFSLSLSTAHSDLCPLHFQRLLGSCRESAGLRCRHLSFHMSTLSSQILTSLSELQLLGPMNAWIILGWLYIDCSLHSPSSPRNSQKLKVYSSFLFKVHLL